MDLKLFYSCWAHETDLASALSGFHGQAYDGIEGAPPADAALGADCSAALASSEIPYIAEVATGGGYVPGAGLSVQEHLDDLEMHLGERVSAFAPIFVNVLGGSDRWPLRDAIDFFEKGIALGDQYGLEIVWETHRSRPTFTPWVTRDILVALPQMQINCDFSHWCAVCERLVMDEEPEILALVAKRCRHVHARVGYDQGPQVPDPRDPIHSGALCAHLTWWRSLYHAAAARGQPDFTVTPEAGPDGYLQLRPFDHTPAGDLVEINGWIADELRSTLF